jgi:hypothetical protein
MKLFRKVKMQGEYWAVFLVNPTDTSDRRIVSSIFEKEHDAEECAADCNRILEEAAAAVETEGVPPEEPESEITRFISLKDL